MPFSSRSLREFWFVYYKQVWSIGSTYLLPGNGGILGGWGVNGSEKNIGLAFALSFAVRGS